MTGQTDFPRLRSGALWILLTVFNLIVPSQSHRAAAQNRQIPEIGPIPDGRKRNFDQVSEVVRHIQGQVYVVAGIGSNVSVLPGNDGVLIVDAQYAPFTPKLLIAIRQISDRPIRFLVDTHSHADHTGGNENLANVGAIIFGHDNLRKAMANGRRPDGTPSSPGAALPVITYSGRVTFHIDGEEVIVIPAPKPSHTDGDSFIYFSKSNVLATGDVYNGNYPAINAGDSRGLIDNWNFIIELTDSNTKIIPGHGQIFTKADVIALRDAMLTIYDRMRRMIAEGMTFDQVKAARPTREFDARFSVEQEGRNELRTTDAWLKGTYDMLSLEAKVKP